MAGVDLGCRDVQGRTVLHLAVEQDREDCVEVLRAAPGCSSLWNMKDNRGWAPLTLAAERGRPRMLQAVLSVPEPHLEVSVTDPQGRCVAQIAVEARQGEPSRLYSRVQCVQFLWVCTGVYRCSVRTGGWTGTSRTRTARRRRSTAGGGTRRR